MWFSNISVCAPRETESTAVISPFKTSPAAESRFTYPPEFKASVTVILLPAPVVDISILPPATTSLVSMLVSTPLSTTDPFCADADNDPAEKSIALAGSVSVAAWPILPFVLVMFSAFWTWIDLSISLF